MRLITGVVLTTVLISASTVKGVQIDWVTVGNAGNAGVLSGEGAGGAGPDRVCGAVDYAYDIGTYEVTAGQYTEFLNAVAGTDTYGLYNQIMWVSSHGCKIRRTGSSGNYSYAVAEDWADRPVNFVSWGDAARFANWLHNGQPAGLQDLTTTEDGAYFLDGANSDVSLLAVVREPDAQVFLPSEDEWFKAAYYDGAANVYFDYATGSHTAPGFVNNDGDLSGAGQAFMEGGLDPGGYATYDGDGGAGSESGIGSPYYRSEVGEWENSASPYGTFDQGGNVWEWTEAVLHGTSRGVRGGSVNDHANHLHANERLSNFASYEIATTGFRVARVPEPGSLVLIAIGLVGLLRRKRG